MATEKFSDDIAADADEELVMTNLGIFGVIWRGGTIRIEMDEPGSSLPVVVLDSTENAGCYEGRMVGTALRIVNKSATIVSASVYEE